MKAKENIAALQALMKKEGIDGYLIPSSDPHMSEYLPDHYTARSWFSGFNGSAGTLAVTSEKAALWADGRYFVQAEHQLEGSGIELMKIGEPGVPTVEKWLADELPGKGVMGIDGVITSTAFAEELKKAFSEKEISLKNADLIAPIWNEDRPAAPATKAWILDAAYAGKTPSEKLAALRESLKEEGVNAYLATKLESSAWLLNLRADDILFTPFALCFTLVLPDSATVFINKDRVPAEVQEYLEKEGFAIAPYEETAAALRSIETPVTFIIEKTSLSYALYQAMEENDNITVKEGKEPVVYLKGVKSEAEIRNLKIAHRKDGVAMVRFAIDLEGRMARKETVTECDVDAMMRHYRLEQEDSLGESFGTIAAYGPNAAMMHYHPTPENCATLKPEGFLLVDCGGHYLEGTTDITRTYALGEPTEEEKDYFTLVLRSHIDMAKVVFKEKMPGIALDLAAREPFWERGLDYRCGTGHGVGFVGTVHEGPQALNGRCQVPFVPGMTVTDEPGIYETDKIGIRIENELLCKEAMETEYGKFYCFEPITYCPIDRKAIDPKKLSPAELTWLNQYHATVYETLAPYLTDSEKEWLKKACAPIA